MIDLRHPLAVLANRLPWAQIESVLAPAFARWNRQGQAIANSDLFGTSSQKQLKDKNKLYALHAPEIECIGKGKARKPYEFSVRASIAVTHKSGLMVGARTFPDNPYDGHTLSAQLEQTGSLLEDVGRRPKEVVVDLGSRGVDHDNLNVEIIHRGKYNSLTAEQRGWRKRRQAVEPAIGHLKSDHRMDRCWLQGQLGDAMRCTQCYVPQATT
jgi:IS5 family transposase